MSNPHPPAPPPRVTTPTHPHNERAGMSLVEQYNLTGLIRDKRLHGKSYRDITKEINDSGVIPNGYQISHNAIARWCRDNNLGGDKADLSEDEAINVYNEKVKSLNLINTAIDIITVQLDVMNGEVGKGTVKVTDLKAIVDSLDKLTLRQQTLATDIGALQEKVYRYEVVARAMNIIRDILRAKLNDEDYTMVMDSFAESPALVKALQTIAPSGAV